MNNLTHITVMGEFECQGNGCPYCADDDKHLLKIIGFVLDSLAISDEKLAAELLAAWKEQQQ